MARKLASVKSAAPAGSPRLEDLIQVRVGRLIEIIAQLAKRSTGARGMRNTDLRILNLLYDARALSVNELARRAHVDKAWISRSVTELLERRMVFKSAALDDARVQLISLTPRSRAMLEKIHPVVLANEKQLLAGIDEKALKKSLDRMVLNAELLLEQIQSDKK